MSRKYIRFDAHGNILEQTELPNEATPLDPTGALATLLAVLEVTTVQDAANAVGLTPDDLIAEAQAWEAARS
jgi:hypothetical protein